jgi:hypothetical protein
MGIEFVTGWSVECGGLNELENAPSFGAVVSSPAPMHANETYCIAHGWKATSICPKWTLSSSPWYTVQCNVRVTDWSPTTALDAFLNFEDGVGSCWSLSLNTSGQIELYDAGDNLVATSVAGLLPDDTWKTIAVKAKFSNSTDLMVWVGGVRIFNESNFDASSGGTVGTVYTINASAIDTLYCDHIVVLKDDGASIDTNAQTASDTYYYRCYQNTTQGAVPDTGDTLDGGTEWNDAGELPAVDGTYARYDVSPFGPTSKYGQVNCDDGTRTGPNGDAAIGALDEVVGAIYVCRAKSYQGVPAGRKVDLEHYYGSSTSVSTSTKYLNLPHTWSHDSNKANLLDSAHANCPLKTEYARHGAKIYAGTLAGRGYIGELFAMMLFREVVGDDVGVVQEGVIDA